jgi:hypothetical protein
MMPTKTDNGKNNTPHLADVTARLSEETKEAAPLLAANQEACQQSFEIWREFTQTYANFILQATQETLRQSLAFRENMDKILTDNFKKAHHLNLEERQFVVDAAELFQTQAQAGSEYTAKLFTTTSKMMTTTALFSDWAAERVAKMFTSISTT